MSKNNYTQIFNNVLKQTRQILLCLYMIIMAVIIIYFLYDNWPEVDKIKEGELFILVILAGALGSYIHAATSLTSFIGNKSFVVSWTWWYILRPFIGVAIAIVVYFILRAGFLTIGGDSKSISPYGIVAFAALAGMFSKNATDKLAELFDTLFQMKKGGGDEQRADKLGDITSATKAMIPKNKMIFHILKAEDTLDKIKIENLYRYFKGSVTRLPILDEKDVFKMLIHQGLLHKFIAEKNIETVEQQQVFKIEDSTLKDFIDHPGIKELAIDSVGFISLNSTLSEAKIKMEATEKCQDIMITQNGKNGEPIIGWLTNVDISKYLNKSS